MRLTPLALPIFAFLVGCIPVAQADDPAIIVCEEIIKLGLVAPKTYERVSARVDEISAHISYDAMNAAGVPLRNMRSCDFSFDITDGKFHLSMQKLTDELERKTAAIEARRKDIELRRIQAGGLPTYEQRKPALDRADAELAGIEKDLRVLLAEGLENISLYMSYDALAASLGVYPIPPENTLLKASEHELAVSRTQASEDAQ